MTIDEAITHAREVAIIHSNNDKLNKTLGEASPYYKTDCLKCAEEHEQLAEWLEELKAFKENKWTDIYTKRGYNKAICDFVGRLHFELLESVGTDKEQMEFAVRVIDIVAERLKAGVRE